MTILVTGGAGYIGSHTCVELLNKGYDVVVIDNLVNSSAKAIERVEEITGKRVAFYENDVRDRAALDRIFEKHDINCAIHFAGLKAVGESVAMPLEYYDNNLFSTVRLCEAMRDHGVKNIVFSSSATVYTGDNEMPLRETSRTAPAGDFQNRHVHKPLRMDQIHVGADPAGYRKSHRRLFGLSPSLFQPDRCACQRDDR